MRLGLTHRNTPFKLDRNVSGGQEGGSSLLIFVMFIWGGIAQNNRVRDCRRINA